jgi:hypothetical protein
MIPLYFSMLFLLGTSFARIFKRFSVIGSAF